MRRCKVQNEAFALKLKKIMSYYLYNDEIKIFAIHLRKLAPLF